MRYDEYCAQILINKLENVEVEAARIVTGGTVPDLYP
jgi:hypothetical protein